MPDASGDNGQQTSPDDDAPLQRLLSGLPDPVRRGFQKLRQPGAKWVRIPLGVLLVCGGIVGFLPILGFWMVPLGLLLLAQDIPVLKRPTMRALAAVQRWWDRRRT